jgi:hypothetical protein
MALINVADHEIHCKVVYYGPGMSGKTTNLQYIHTQVPEAAHTNLVSISTETERTLFFDFLPIDLGKVQGFQARLHLYTVPGQVMYERTRLAVLNGVDGVVFVADSDPERIDEDVESLAELEQNLQKQGKHLDDFPFVLQYNKRDLQSALPTAVLNQRLNRGNWQHFETTATAGQGVLETLRAISQQVLSKL